MTVTCYKLAEEQLMKSNQNHSSDVCVRQAQALVRDSPLLTKLANSALYPLIYVVQQFIHWLFMGYPLVPFCLFTYDKWLKVTYRMAGMAFTCVI